MVCFGLSASLRDFLPWLSCQKDYPDEYELSNRYHENNHNSWLFKDGVLFPWLSSWRLAVEVQDTGVAPTDDGFTILERRTSSETEDGNEQRSPGGVLGDVLNWMMFRYSKIRGIDIIIESSCLIHFCMILWYIIYNPQMYIYIYIHIHSHMCIYIVIECTSSTDYTMTCFRWEKFRQLTSRRVPFHGTKECGANVWCNRCAIARSNGVWWWVNHQG